MTMRVNAFGQQAADLGAAVFLSGGRPPGSFPAELRRELRCRGCGFGAIVAQPLARCPMCGRGDWLLISPMPGYAGAEGVRS